MVHNLRALTVLRELRLHFQHAHGRLQPAVTPVQGIQRPPQASRDTVYTWHRDIHAGKTLTHII